jgi:DNA-binding transcriptional regulator YdaS (Cro superfamily)
MPLEHDSDSPLAKIVRRAGSQSAFARVIGTRQSTVHGWLRLNKPLPAELVATVERELGIPRHESRPDLFKPEGDASRQLVEANR